MSEEEMARIDAEFEAVRADREGMDDPAPAPSVTVRLADVQPELVSWLWDARVPLGKLTLIDGDPGLGKSTLALEIIARLTTGRALPEGGAISPANVVILTAEDGLADTVRPRLDAAGADVNRVFALTAARADDGEEIWPTLDKNLAAVADAMKRHEARLVVIDPIMAFLGGEVNSWRDQDVRRVLTPLSKLAEETGAAVVGIRHLTKGGGTNAVYRGGGSIGIAGAARSVLLVAKDPENDARRIIASVKSNLGIPPSSLAYRVESAGLACRIVFDGTSEMTADGLLTVAAADAEPEGRSARDDAASFLADLLVGGAVPTPDIQREARKAGHAWRTVRRAKDGLGVVVEKLGLTGGWIWRLPVEGGQGVHTIERTPSGMVGLLREGGSSDDDPPRAISDDDKEAEPEAASGASSDCWRCRELDASRRMGSRSSAPCNVCGAARPLLRRSVGL
jgi:hypothetical protein